MHHGAQNNVSYFPPLNFAMVVKDVYRSAYPTEANIPYLRDIGIKTLVLLSIESLAAKVLKALEDPLKVCIEQGRFSPSSPLNSLSNTRLLPSSSTNGKGAELANTSSAPCRGIRVLRLANMRSWREDALNSGHDFSQRDVMRGLDLAVDARWHPILFACPTGEMQTNVLIGCLRRYQNWSLSAIFNECELFTSLTRSTQSQVLNFISMWVPEENPISEFDIVLRNREWMRQVDASSKTCNPRGKGAVADGIPTHPKAERALPHSEDDADEDGYRANTEELGMNALSMRENSLLNSGNAKSLPSFPDSGTLGRADSSILGGKPSEGFRFAEWYLESLLEFPVLGDVSTQEGERAPSVGSEKAVADTQLPPPHVRYAWVRNPPSLDSRSTFTKESVVEEDDD
ncbi:unnamed protein product [Phytomonas sp. EM1]|nr:unnamed protein product [Phytomonas sp. EM1]|eukprot:CCW62767.1 unnamed protein product [Phytomonas sp. isolate EM1]